MDDDLRAELLSAVSLVPKDRLRIALAAIVDDLDFAQRVDRQVALRLLHRIYGRYVAIDHTQRTVAL